jgi:hypothetical protein
MSRPKEWMDLSKLTLIVVDRGGFSHVAQFLARFYGRVKYFKVSEGNIFPKSPSSQIGKGLPGIEWIDNFYAHSESADVVFFPYIYDEGWIEDLRKRGMPVCGAGKAAKMELKKDWFLAEIKKVGLPVPYTARCKGIDDALEYCKRNSGKRLVLKYAEKFRGDFESFVHKNIYATEILLNRIRANLGPERAREVQILAQNWIEGFETGVDPFRLNGDMPKNSCLGYEMKDSGYILKVFPEFPEIIQKTLDKLGLIYNRLGYAAAYSNELRIDSKARVFPIDETTRCGCPPTACITEVYDESYAQAIWSLANWQMPILKPKYKYGAEIELNSPFHIEDELHIGCPKGFENHLKLSAAVYKRGQYFCVPDLTDKDQGAFGAVVGFGNTRKEAQNMALDAAEELEVYKMDYDKNVFDEADEVIETGRKFGIDF